MNEDQLDDIVVNLSSRGEKYIEARVMNSLFQKRQMGRLLYNHYHRLYRIDPHHFPYSHGFDMLNSNTLMGHFDNVENAVYFIKNPHASYDNGYMAVTDGYDDFQWSRYKEKND